jgi:hypothetical protein
MVSRNFFLGFSSERWPCVVRTRAPSTPLEGELDQGDLSRGGLTYHCQTPKIVGPCPARGGLDGQAAGEHLPVDPRRTGDHVRQLVIYVCEVVEVTSSNRFGFVKITRGGEVDPFLS